MYFDARAAKLLAPGDHLVVDGCAGLRLVATQTKKTWTVRYKDASGRMKQVAIGQWPAMPAQGAVAAWQALKESRATGADPAQERQARRDARSAPTKVPAVYSVRNLVDDYIAGPLSHSRKSAGALAAQRRLLGALDSDPAFADMPAGEVTRGVAFALIDAKKATPTAAHKLRSLLGAAWDHALDAGALDGNAPNWWRQVLRGKLKSKGKIVGGVHVGQARRVLSNAEVARLLAWLPNMHARAQDCVVMYLWTCARGSEFLAMRAEHVGIERGQWWWTVPKAATKNERNPNAVDLRVPLFGRALDVVRRRRSGVGASGWLFEDARGEQYTQQDFSTYIYNLQPYAEKVTARLGDGLVLPVTHWTPHNLRRTARTLLAQLGCPNEIGEAIIGHLPPAIVGTYNSFTYDAERALWLARLSDWLDEAGRG